MHQIHEHIKAEAQKIHAQGPEAIAADEWQAVAKETAFFEAVERFERRQHPKFKLIPNFKANASCRRPYKILEVHKQV